MEITNLFFKQLQSANTSNNLQQNFIADISKSKASFENQYQAYKNQYQTKAQDNYSQTSKQTKSVEPKKEYLKSSSTNNKVKNVNKEDNNLAKSKDKIQDKTEVSEKIIAEIAEKLNIPVENIKQALEELNIDIFALMDNTNLNSFLQSLFDVQNPEEMLVSSEIQQAFKDITNIMQQNKDIIEDVTNTQVQIPLENMVDNKAEKTVTESVTAETLNGSQKNGSQDLNAENQIITETKDDNKLPLVEINTETDSKSSNNQNNQSNDQNFSGLLAQNTNNETTINTYTVTDSQQQFTVNEIVASTKSAAPKDVHQIVTQIVEKIKIDFKPEITEMKLSLRPESLGELSLKISTQNNVVVAQFIAESQQVKEIIQANINTLKDTLQQMGLEINELSVSVRQQESDTRQQFNQNQEKSKRRIQQILNNDTDDTLDTDIITSDTYRNPYNISENQVDYTA